MTAPTIKKINAAIAKHGIELVKGEWYFYFAALDGAAPGIEDAIPSVYSMHLRALTLEEWIAHVEEAVAGFEADRAAAEAAEAEAEGRVFHQAIGAQTHGGAGNGNTYRFKVTYSIGTGERVTVLSTCERDVAQTYERHGEPVPEALAGPYDSFGRPLEANPCYLAEAVPGAHECPALRAKRIERRRMNIATGTISEIDRVETRVEACGAPLFGAEQEAGICKFCAAGWSVPGNRPAHAEERIDAAAEAAERAEETAEETEAAAVTPTVFGAAVAGSFAEATALCVAMIESGTAEGRRRARAELDRYARELDRLAASAGSAFLPDDTPIAEA